MRCAAKPSRIPMASSAHHDRWIREEAAMVAITLNTVHQTARVREQLKTVHAFFREMLDAFVSNRMRRAAAEAGWARPRGRRGMRALSAAPRQVITIDERTMIAMQMTSPDVSWRQTPRRSTAASEQDGERSGILPPGETPTVTAQFQPLHSRTLNA